MIFLYLLLFINYCLFDLQMNREQYQLDQPQQPQPYNRNNELQSLNSNLLQNEIKTTNQAIQQLSSQIKLQHNKKIYIANKEQYNLIAGNNRNRSKNQTIKRSSPYMTLKDNTSNQRTKDQIRMKIILQNNRLKANIQALKSDMNGYRDNQTKIVEVLRESKNKITEYKDKLKQKSKKISELTDSNISLKNKLAQLQSKYNQISSFSEWQAQQIKQLQAQLAKATNESNYKVDKFSTALKNDEQVNGHLRLNEQIQINIHNSAPISSQSINERTPYSIKQMQIHQMQFINQGQQNEQTNELNQQREANNLLKNRLMELQYQLDHMRTLNRLKQDNLLQTQQEKQIKEKELQENMQNIMKKSLSVTRQLQQKDALIQQLQLQINSLKQKSIKMEENFIQNQQNLKKQINQLNQIMNKNGNLMQKMQQQLREKQQKEQLSKKQLEQVLFQIDQNYQNQKQYQNKIQQLKYNLQQSQRKKQDLKGRIEQLEAQIQQNEQTANHASTLVTQKHKYQQEIKRLTRQLEYYRKQSEQNVKYFQEKLAQNENQIKQLRKQKQLHHQQMQQHLHNIILLKNDIKQLNHEKHDNFGSHKELYDHIIPQQKDDSEDIIQSQASHSKVQLPQPKEQNFQNIPFFNSFPLPEPISLDQDKTDSIDKIEIRRRDQIIDGLERKITEMQKQFKQKLDEQMQKNTMEEIQVNYSLFKQKQQEIELKKELQEAHNEIMQKKIYIQNLQYKIQLLQKQLKSTKQQVYELKIDVDKKDHLLNSQNEHISQLQQLVQLQRNKHKFIYQQMKILTQSKLKLKEELQIAMATKNQLTNSLQIELSHKEIIQNQLINSKRLVQQHLEQIRMREQLNQQVQIYKNKQKALEEKVRVINLQKDQINQHYLHIQQQFEQLQQQQNKKQQEINLLKSNISNQQQKNATLNEQKNELNRQSIYLKKQIVQKQSQLSLVKIQIEQYDTRSKIDQAKIEQLENFQKKTRKQIQEKLQILSNIIDQQKNRIQKMNFQKAELINEKQFINDQLIQLKTDKKHLQQLKNELQNQLEAQKKNKSEQAEKLYDQFYEQTEKNNNLKDKIQQYESLINKMKAELLQKDQLKRINQQIKLKLLHNQKMIKDLSINIASLKESLQLSHSDHDQHDLRESKQNEDSISLKLQQTQQPRVGIDSLRQDISHIQNKHKSVIEDYQHKLRSTSVKIEEITQEKQGKISQLQNIIVGLKNQIADVDKAKDNIQSTNKQLKQIIADHLVTIQKLQKQLNLQKELISSKDLIIQSFQKSQGLKKGEIDTKDKIIDDLQSKLASITSQNQQKRIQVDQLLNKIKRQQMQVLKIADKHIKDIGQLNDNLQVSKKMRQEIDEQYGFKFNKLNKQLSNYKFLLQQAQKQNSFKLEQSNRSIDEIRDQLKIYTNNLKQKEQQIKQLKEKCSLLKEQYEKQKISCNRFEEDKNTWEQQKISSLNQINEINQQIAVHKTQINNLRATINHHKAELQKNSTEINNYKLSIKQLKAEVQNLIQQKKRGESKMQGLKQQKLRLQQKLQQVALQRNKFQTQCEQLQQQNKKLHKRKNQQHEEMQISTMSIIEQQKEVEQQNQILVKQKQKMLEQIKNIHKQYQTRIENVCLQQREVLLDVQNKHKDQIEAFNKKIQSLQREYKKNNEKLKENEAKLTQQLEKIRQTFKKDDKTLKQFQNERGQLTDRIIHLTQENNQLHETFDNLRNNIVSKGDQIQSCRQTIQKLQEQIQQLRSKKEGDAYEFVGEIMQANKQLKKQVQILSLQLRQKQKQLNDKLQKQKQKQTRQRNSSGDSWVSRSKIFDQKNLMGQLEQTKAKLQDCEAYIVILEQDKSNAQKDKEQIEQLKMKIQSLQAYIAQLQHLDMKSSVRSRQSFHSKIRNQQEAQKSQSHNNNSQDINRKIYLLIDCIDQFSHDKSLQKRLIQVRDQLDNPALQQLLNTVFSRLQRQALICKNKQQIISQLNETLQQKLKEYKDGNNIFIKKISILQEYKKKYQQYQTNIQNLLTQKMMVEADLAQSRSQLEILQNKLNKHEIKNNRQQSNKKDALEILPEQDESSSDSMMSQSADSQIPSSVNQSKEFKSSVDIRGRGKGQFLSMSKSIMRTKSFNIEEKNNAVDFLKKCLVAIKQLQNQIQKIQKQLDLKTKLLNLCLSQSVSKEELINKLSIVESKIKMNDRQLKNYFQTSQLEIAALIKNLLRYREQNDQYGLKNQSRRKVQEYLSLLQQQLTKNSKFYEQESMKIQQNSRRSQNSSPSRLGTSLHEIKQDAVNEDKGSSIVHPKNGQVIRSFSNSQGVTESLDINEIKNNYNETLKQLHQVHDELNTKQQIIKNIHQKYTHMQQQVFLMLEEFVKYFEEDQFLFDQVEKIKKFLIKNLQEQPFSTKIKESQEKSKIQKCNILVQSNNKNGSIQRRFENPFQKLLKFSDDEFHDCSEGLSNQCLKQIYNRIEQLIKQRFDDCLDFLNTQRSLIADIMKIDQNQSILTEYVNILASKLTKQEITDIITNSHNRIEAKKIINQIIREEDAKSMVSDQNDFSPNANKMQQIRSKIYLRPTQFSLTLHNQLLQILAAPTRNEFYNLIEQFYKIIKSFEDRYYNDLSQKQEQSLTHSIRIKKVLEGEGKEVDFSIQKMDYLDIKQHKNRSNSYQLKNSQYN